MGDKNNIQKQEYNIFVCVHEEDRKDKINERKLIVFEGGD
jgi:hypothetical protein